MERKIFQVGVAIMLNIAEAADYSFDAEVLKCDVAVITNFWAEWCAPCKKLNPILQNVAELYGEHIKVVNVNIDHNPITTANYSVLSIPTLIIFRNGIPVERMTGQVPEDELLAILKPHMPIQV